jgi:tetratricopeptide (TPR) repeat protein
MSKKNNGNRNRETAQAKSMKKAEAGNEKTFPMRNQLYIVLFLLLFVGGMLVASGMFDEPKVSGGSPPVEHQHSEEQGADLTNAVEIGQLEEKISANPSDTAAVLQLGHLYNDSRFFEKAIEKYLQYLKSNPKNAEVIIDMGVCFFNLNKYAQADSIVKIALRFSPNHPVGLFNLGIINLNWEKTDIAKQWFTQLIETRPNSAQAANAKKLLESHFQ